MIEIDLEKEGVRGVNSRLHALPKDTNERHWLIKNPMGQHAIACGLDAPITVEIGGHAGFYCGGMNKHAEILIHGHAGPGVAENMMSGIVRVDGNASQSAGATGNGGLLVIKGDAASRCGISMKGIDIVVGGSVGHMSAFMALCAEMRAKPWAIPSMRRSSMSEAKSTVSAPTASKSR